MTVSKAAVLVGFIVLLSASNALGLTPIPGEERFASLTPKGNHAGAALGYRAIDGDHFITLVPLLELNLGMVGLGLALWAGRDSTQNLSS